MSNFLEDAQLDLGLSDDFVSDDGVEDTAAAVAEVVRQALLNSVDAYLIVADATVVVSMNDEDEEGDDIPYDEVL